MVQIESRQGIERQNRQGDKRYGSNGTHQEALAKALLGRLILGSLIYCRQIEVTVVENLLIGIEPRLIERKAPVNTECPNCKEIEIVFFFELLGLEIKNDHAKRANHYVRQPSGEHRVDSASLTKRSGT